MSTALPQKLLTAAEFEALHNDGMERDLVRGQLSRERSVTKRNRFHARTEARISQQLCNWLDANQLGGSILSGEVGTILRRDPDTVVDIDIAYFDAEVIAQQSDVTTMIEGAPVLAVEILSPSDKQEDIHGKIDDYREAQVPVIWIVDPHFRTVTVHSRDNLPRLFSGEQIITVEPFLPGLHICAREIFE